MVRISMFNDALKSMYNAKKRGKRLTKCGVISPRFDVGVNEIEFGYTVLTTSAGIVDHKEARWKKVGGKVP